MLLHGDLAFAKVGPGSWWRAVPTLCYVGGEQFRLPCGNILQRRSGRPTQPATIHPLADAAPPPETAHHFSPLERMPRSGRRALQRIDLSVGNRPLECSSRMEAPVLHPCLGKLPVLFPGAEAPAPGGPGEVSR